jgi:hypothetical protein
MVASMHFVVRNTFINAIKGDSDSDDEDELYRAASEGYAASIAQRTWHLPLKHKAFHRQAVDAHKQPKIASMDEVDEHPLEWLMPTPPSSAPQSPREVLPDRAEVCASFFSRFSGPVNSDSDNMRIEDRNPLAFPTSAARLTLLSAAPPCPPGCFLPVTSWAPETIANDPVPPTLCEGNHMAEAPEVAQASLLRTMMEEFSSQDVSRHSLECELESLVAAASARMFASASLQTSLQPLYGVTSIPQKSSANSKLLPMPMRPNMGCLHRFHNETEKMGVTDEDGKRFRKISFDGLLSLVTEDQIRTHGTHRYLVQFSEGQLSSADGVGFVFSSTLPCPKNIQRIVSIFVNRAGYICTRAFSKVKRSAISVKMLELGDWIELSVDLENKHARFTVWPADGGTPTSASVDYGYIFSNTEGGDLRKIHKCQDGYLACLIKSEGVMVTLGS